MTVTGELEALVDGIIERHGTPRDLVRHFYPDAEDDECDFILWERTAFPFSDPVHTAKQIRSFKRKTERYPGRRLCDFCDRLAVRFGYATALCRKCDKALSANREDKTGDG